MAHRCLLATGAVGALLLFLLVREAGGPSPHQIRKAFAWFDTLGYPDLSRARYVRVATGWWTRSGNEEPQNRCCEAFLLSEQGDEFKVLMTDLSTPTFRKTGSGTREHERVGWEPADLPACARKRIDDLVALMKTDRRDRDTRRRWGEMLGERAELFVLARGCASQGQEKLALELCDLASTLDEGRNNDCGQPFLRIVSDEIAHAEMWRAVLRFGEPEVPRKDLLASFQAIVRDFPESEHVERARKTAEVLERMVREEDERSRKPPKPFQEMTKAEQAVELVFQLRDQNGVQWSQPGWVDFFNDRRGVDSPAARLLALELDAVLALIEALDDPRFTRSVEYHRDFYFSHDALTVGDAARAVLERIACRDLDPPRKEGATDADRKAETKELARRWWAEFEKKGERQMLIEAARRGEVAAAARLVEKFQAEALDAVAGGARNAEGPGERARLIEIASKIEGEEATAFLRAEMKGAPDVFSRVAAAEGLLRRGISEGVAAMIGEWEELDADDDRLISFLANCASRDALTALGRNLSKRPVDRRLQVVEALGGGYARYWMSKSTDREPLRPGDGKDGKPDPILTAVVEEILVAALEDDTECEGTSGSWGDKSYTDPRICDMAGHVLRMRWPSRFEFDIAVPLRQRDRARIELRNVVRKERGQPSLPLPEILVPKPLPLDEVEPMVKKVLDAAPGTDRKKAAAEIESRGSPALPALVSIIERLEAGSLPRLLLEPLSIRLACRVEELELVTGDLDPGEALKESVEALRGCPLDAERIADLFIQAYSMLPEGASGLRITADRDATLTGVRVKITFLEAWTGSGPNPGAQNTLVESGDELLEGSWGGSVERSRGSSGHDYGLMTECPEDFRKAVEKALASPPERPFLIRISQSLDPR